MSTQQNALNVGLRILPTGCDGWCSVVGFVCLERITSRSGADGLRDVKAYGLVRERYRVTMEGPRLRCSVYGIECGSNLDIGVTDTWGVLLV